MSRIAIMLFLVASLASHAAAQTTRPAGVDEASWQRMLEIDAKAGEVKDLVADFEQQKITAMLRKPLVSSGQVFVRGSAMLWKTRKPEPSGLQINEKEVRIYYPSQKTIEVYQIRQKLGQLAASPLPRLQTLREHFVFKPLPLSEMKESDEGRFFAVEMTPIDPELGEHVETVRVLLDATRGLIVRFEMSDADGERTVITFSNVRTNVGLKDEQLAIDAPADVKVTRPLAGVEGEPGEAEQDKSK